MIKFGTGGWRAVIGDEFTKENIQILSRAICDKMREEKVAQEGIVIGYDRRFLSKEAMQWAAQVFAAEGIKASLINKSAPTPLVMFYVMKHEYHYGMMITASHNPAIYNGIKVFTYGGRDADEVQTADIERYINEVTDIPVEEMSYAEGIEKGLIEEIYPLNEYLDSIIDTVDMEKIKARGLRVALDPMYGVSETSLKTILMTARCEVETIHERHDTLFGGKLPAPTAETLRALQNYVVDRRCDLGLATDGDADRIGVIDDQGNFLHPNDILVLLYYYLVKYKGWNGPAVRNICTTHLLDRVAESFGEKCYEVPVGFKHVSAKMYESDAIIGGESSGGMAVRGHIKGKDGIYASALLVVLLAGMGAYALARYKFPGSNLINSLVVGAMMFPAFATVIAVFQMEYQWGIANTGSWFRNMLSVILPQVAGNMAFAMVVLTGYIKGLPIELEEAAYMEGCSAFQIYFKVIMPLTKPSFATVAIFSFLWSYNDLFTQSFFLRRPDMYSITMMLNNISAKEGTDYGLMAAVVALIIVPVIIVYCCLQKQIIKGMIAGAVKG